MDDFDDQPRLHVATSSPRSEKNANAFAVVMDSALFVAGDLDHEPPSYEDSTAAMHTPQSDRLPEVLNMYRRLYQVRWDKYMPPGAQISTDASTVTITLEASARPSLDALTKFVVEQTRLAPQPKCSITGKHNTWTETITDFDLILTLTPYILRSDSTEPGSLRWTDPTGQKGQTRDPSTFEQEVGNALATCYRNADKPQSIVIERQVTNFDKDMVTSRVFGLVGMIRYKGNLKVHFPINQTKVVINLAASASEASTPSEPRGFFSNITSYVTGSRQTTTLQVNWPWATQPAVDSSSTSSLSTRPRTYTSKDENAWFADWEGVIRRAIIRRETTNLGLDSWVQNVTDPLRKAEMPKSDWCASCR